MGFFPACCVHAQFFHPYCALPYLPLQWLLSPLIPFRAKLHEIFYFFNFQLCHNSLAVSLSSSLSASTVSYYQLDSTHSNNHISQAWPLCGFCYYDGSLFEISFFFDFSDISSWVVTLCQLPFMYLRLASLYFYSWTSDQNHQNAGPLQFYISLQIKTFQTNFIIFTMMQSVASKIWDMVKGPTHHTS